MKSPFNIYRIRSPWIRLPVAWLVLPVVVSLLFWLAVIFGALAGVVECVVKAFDREMRGMFWRALTTWRVSDEARR